MSSDLELTKRPGKIRVFCIMCLGLSCNWNDRDVGALLELADEVGHPFFIKLHKTTCHGVDGVILTSAGIKRGMNNRTALADDDFTGLNVLTIGTFNTQALGL